MLRYDVAVIGAGIVGCAVARELSRYDLRLAVLEKEADVGGGAAKANSGIIHAGFHSTPGTLRARLCVLGNRLYPKLSAELDVPFRRNGVLMAAKDAAEMTILHEYRQRGRENGLTNLRIIHAGELARLEPNLAPGLAGGLLAPHGGIIASYELAAALAENARANDTVFYLNSPLTGAKQQRKGYILRAGRIVMAADYVVNAAGLGAADVAGLAGNNSFTLRARKGEEYILDRRLAGLVRRTIFPLPSPVSKGVLIIPTTAGNIMLGPTAVETDAEDDRSTSQEGWEEVLSRAKALLPGIDPRDLIASFAGLRAYLPEGDFHIKSAPGSPRWINAAGIQSPGLTAAPAIARYVADMLREAGLALRPRRGFNPERPTVRFRSLTEAERERLIHREPSYGRIVCRCEMVTEGEVIAAIRAGAVTLDGIKARTRAGMGRCQGGFCTPRLIEILARELGVDPSVVTKRGGASRILTGSTRAGRRPAGGVR